MSDIPELRIYHTDTANTANTANTGNTEYTEGSSYYYRPVSTTSNIKETDTDEIEGGENTSRELGSARAPVDYQDKLWTQIDVLDDVKRMSESAVGGSQRRLDGQSEKVRELQLRILGQMKQIEQSVDGGVVGQEFEDISEKMQQLEKLVDNI